LAELEQSELLISCWKKVAASRQTKLAWVKLTPMGESRKRSAMLVPNSVTGTVPLVEAAFRKVSQVSGYERTLFKDERLARFASCFTQAKAFGKAPHGFVITLTNPSIAL
jgi:hypothetical protein